MARLVLLAALLMIAGLARAEDLPRHPRLNVDLADSGPLAVRIPAGADGFAVGDVVTAIDGAAVAAQADLDKALKAHTAGEFVEVSVRRAGRPLILHSRLIPAALEQAPDMQILYRAVRVGPDLRRVIVTRPLAGGRHPAILLIGGLGCYSLDGMPPDEAPFGRLLYELTRRGYVTMRVEKTREGDSQGPDCSAPQADFKLEVAGYAAGLQALETYDFVDPARTFIFAHSIGPLDAVLTAQQAPVRGIILAETIGRGWYDYELEIVRQQALEVGVAYDDVERSTRRYERCLHAFYVEKQSAAQIVAADRDCRDILVPGIPDAYLHQVADLDLAAEWKKLDVPVLVIYGGSDPATSPDESHYLVNLINSFHRGKASYLEIPGMGHTLSAVSSKAEFLRSHGGPHPKLHEAVLPAVEAWLHDHA